MVRHAFRTGLGRLGFALAVGASLRAAALDAQQSPGVPADSVCADSTASIHQVVDLPASPARVYGVLLNAHDFAAFSGRAATIDSTVGGAFSLFDAHIVGRNLELVPGRRVVQAWRVVDWPEGVYSIVRFDLVASGSGTRLTLTHLGYPAGLHDHLAAGWQANYWSLLDRFFR
ncbi:MAG: SRPBCC domain-containing protein [Gemmatimonadales bacterium]